jgi:hypothetical protein
MKVSFNQPAFIPWGGFFARLIASDRMVLLDETALARGFTYVNRNRVKGPEGEVWVTVSLRRKGRGAQQIKELEIYEKEKWANKFIRTLKHYYGKSIYFEPVLVPLGATMQDADPHFLSLVLSLLNIIKASFDLDNEMLLQSDLEETGKGTSLLVAIAKKLRADEVILPYFSAKAVEAEKFQKENMRVRFLRYEPPQYPQFWGRFIPNLSALDLLLCCGKEGRAIIKKGIHLYDQE